MNRTWFGRAGDGCRAAKELREKRKKKRKEGYLCTPGITVLLSTREAPKEN